MMQKVLTLPESAVLAGVLLLASSSAWSQADGGNPEGEPGGEPSVEVQDADPRTTEAGRAIVRLSGTAIVLRNGNLNVTPVRVKTGMVEIGDAVTVPITLSHAGNPEADPIAIGAAVMIGANANEFTTPFSGYQTIQPGDSLEVSMTFTPSIPGKKSAGLRLSIDGATAPYVVLIEGSARFPLTSDLAISPNEITFGQSLVGQSIKKSFTLSNEGEGDSPEIGIADIALGGDTPEAFEIEFSPLTLAPGESTEMSVTMNSTSAGSKSADVSVTHDGNNPALEAKFSGTVIEPTAVPVNFTASDLNVSGVTVNQVTSLQFGPDGKLYYSEMNGPIQVLDVKRNGKNNYSATHVETINLVRDVDNYNDDGSKNNNLNKRLVTGLLLAGTAANPNIYVTSSDPRQGGGPPQPNHGPNGNDTNLDTNSGIVHKLTKSGGAWKRQDIVRGLPRSEENHVPNGMMLKGNKLLVMTGGHTNQGVPSVNFAALSEYALSAALLEIDLGQIGNGTYDLPTLDDEDRPGANDENDPFGGNNGKNQAKLVSGGPVSIYASGFRNAYDVTEAPSGKIYTFDNGPNTNWGGTPKGDCLNDLDNGGNKFNDGLHQIEKGSYHGHPNPVRGNKDNKFNDSNPQSPIEGPANPEECKFKKPGNDGALTTIDESTNGLVVYSATNFGGAMFGDILAAGFRETLYRIELNANGTDVTSKSVLIGNLGRTPLDVTAQGNGDVFPGTIWIGHLREATITVMEPADY